MSDLHDDLNQELGEDSAQPTRKVPPVPGEPSLPRRRRSDRLSGRTGAPAEAEVPSAPQETQAMPAPQPAPQPAPEPRQETIQLPPAQERQIPRPNALNRADRNRAEAERSAPSSIRPRQAVPAPGYDQRRPLGASSGDQPRMARPAVPTLEEQDTPRAGDFTQLGEKPKRRVPVLMIVVIAVLVIALAVLGLLLVPSDSTGPLGGIKRAITGEKLPGETLDVSVMDFTGAPTTGAAPLEITFTMTSSKAVQAVRLVDETGRDMNASAKRIMDNADNSVWIMTLLQAEPFSGGVFLQVSDGTSWLDTGRPLPLQVTGETAPALPTEAPTDAPTQEPVQLPAALTATEAPTQVPVQTEVPTPEATQAPTQEPVQQTEEPTPEVTQAPADTPVPTQEPDPTPTMMVSPTPAVNETAAPTEVPAEQPTEMPTETPTEVPTEAPTEVPAATQEPVSEPAAQAVSAPLVAVASENALPDLIANTNIYNNAARKLDSYSREISERINMPAASAYLQRDFGVLTYRGSAFRQNAASGTVGDLSGMRVLWETPAGSVKGASTTYYGFGWTCQPAIVKWSTEVRQLSNINEEKKATSALKEVIIGGLDGRIYFLDLADGQPTRDAINLGYPMRGTPSIHPYSFPIMSIGQYARKMANSTGGIGMRVYNLLTQKQVYILDGLDGSDNRPYYEVGAFDTSSLYDGAADTMISLGTNGMLYLTRLNTEFDFNKGTISITPSNVTMTSRIKNQTAKYTAVESSMAMYQQYLWYADMEGILRCVDTDSLTTVWAVDAGDAVESAIALDLDADGSLWLYVADELSIRSKGASGIQCYNALTGEKRWQTDVALTASKSYTAGVKAAPVIGQKGLSQLVYYAVSGATAEDGKSVYPGLLVALNKTTGNVEWMRTLEGYVYSSPVAVYTESGRGYIIQADSTGMLTLLDGVTGELLNTLQLEGTIEASPAVYGSTLVIGTTGKSHPAIYGIALE